MINLDGEIVVAVTSHEGGQKKNKKSSSNFHFKIWK